MDLQGRTNTFVGRKEELQQIEEILTAKESAIIEIVGPPGIGKTELVNKALRDTSYPHEYELKYYFKAEDGDKPDFTIFNLIKNLAEDLGEEVRPENGLINYEQLLSAIKRKSNEHSLIVFIDRLDILLVRSEESGNQNKYYRHLMGLLEILKNSDNTKVFLATAYRFEPDNTELKSLSIHLHGLDTPSAIELIKTYDIKGLPYDMQWAVEDYQGHPVAIKLMCENILYLGLDLIMDRFKFDSIFNDDIELCRNWETYLKRRIRTTFLTEELRSILRFVALIDHEFDDKVLTVLFDSFEKIYGIFKVTDEKKQEIFHALQRQYCLDWNTNAAEDNYTLAPLIQKFLYKNTQQEHTELWNTVHQDLYEHYQSLPAEDHPQNDQEIRWLCHAAKHGCAAGKNSEVWRVIVNERLRLNRTKSLLIAIQDHKLLIPLISQFSNDSWLQLKLEQTEPDIPYLLNQTSLALKGHSVSLKEILALDEKSTELYQGNASHMRVSYCNIAVDYRIMGHLQKATDGIQQAISLGQSDDLSLQEKLFIIAESIYLFTHKNEIQRASKTSEEFNELLRNVSTENLQFGDYSVVLVKFYAYTGKTAALEQLSERLRNNAQLMIDRDDLVWALMHRIYLTICSYHLESYTEFVTEASELMQTAQWQTHPIVNRSMLLVYLAKAFLKLERHDELRETLEECYEYVAHYGLNLYLTDYHLVCAEFALVEERLSDAQEHILKARKLIDWSGYELVRAELNELESRAGLEISYRGQAEELSFHSLLYSLFQLITKSPKQSQLLKSLDKDQALHFLREQLGNASNSSISRRQIASYYESNAKNAEIQPSPLWLAWMQNTQKAELQKIMDGLAD